MTTNNKTALIIVDMQNDFISGSLATDPTRDFTKKVAKWLSSSKDKYDLIITTQDWHIKPGDHFEKWPVHCEANTIGAEISEHIQLVLWHEKYYEFLKGQYSDGYSGFDATSKENDNVFLSDFLKDNNVSIIDIVGIATDFCVKETALDGVKHGFTTNVLSEYVNGVYKEASDQLLTGEFQKQGVNVK